MNENQLIEEIKKIIKKNGFPTKQVALPYSKILNSIQNLNLDIDLFLGRLELYDIYTRQDNNRLIFSSTPINSSIDQTSSASIDNSQNILGDNNLNDLHKMGKIELMKKISEMMKNMSPEKMKNIKNIYENMSPDQQKEILDKGKDLGLS